MAYISAIHTDDQVIVWERNQDGDRVVKDYPAPYYFYIDDPDGDYQTVYGNRVSKVEFKKNSEYRRARKEYDDRGIQMWESDITPDIRVLSNHYYGIEAPQLHVTFLDIEVDYDPELGVQVIDMVATNPYAPINSVALYHRWKREYVLLTVPPEEGWTEERLRREMNECAPDAPIPTDYRLKIHICYDEQELLLLLLQELRDSDVVSGWNSDFFDMPYIAQRVARVLDRQPLSLGSELAETPSGKPTLVYTDNPNPKIKQHPGKFRFLRQLDFPTFGNVSFRPVPNPTNGKLMGNTIDTVGRVKIDYMNLVKKYEPGEKPSYALAAIAADVLVDDKTKQPLLPKLEYEGTLADLYRNNYAFFSRYNLRDTEILNGFEDKLGYVGIANVNVHLSTALFSHVNGTLKLAELALINYCHHTLRRVVKNVTQPLEDRQIDGALVLYPQVGLHDFIGSIDINSLYPSAIRSLNISPETIRGQFKGYAADAQKLADGSFDNLTFVFEDSYRGPSSKELTMPATEWREYFAERKWAVSGYGTVFDQTKQGFIPALLAEWYDLRKKYQKLKGESKAAGDALKAGYYDRLQYVYKIKLNSLYGALTNLYFRFFDLRLGESTTGTGRMILRHQCRKTNETLGGSYNVDFPLYETVKDAMESGYTEKEAELISLHGPKFNGKHPATHIIYGDTDSTYFKTHGRTADEAIEIADGVADIVNASFPEFMRESFLCTAGYDNIIKAGREIVSDRGIFVEKKRYILHLINLDGDPVDKMKVMGLDTKKTTLPVHVSKKLNGFIERFLKGETWESVSVSIVEYKDELLNAPDVRTIGLPKGVKGLEDYTSKYEDEGASARLPGHVAASIYYNLMLKQYKDKVSPQISSGMKIRVYYLLGNHGKFKSLALPVDADFVPQWFLDNFKIDKKAHIERLVDNPLGNILKAIGKEPPSKQSLFVDSLFEF